MHHFQTIILTFLDNNIAQLYVIYPNMRLQISLTFIVVYIKKVVLLNIYNLNNTQGLDEYGRNCLQNVYVRIQMYVFSYRYIDAGII